MSRKYSIEQSAELLTVRFFGSLSAEDLRRSMAEAAAIAPAGRRLWDLREANPDLTNEQIQKLGEYARSIFRPPSRVAILASADLAYGLSRIFEVFREQDRIHLRVCRSEAEALAWLAGPLDDNSAPDLETRRP